MVDVKGINQYKQRALLVALGFLIVFYPFFEGIILLDGLLTGVLIASLFSLPAPRRMRWLAIGLCLPYLIVIWLSTTIALPGLILYISRAFGILFFLYAAMWILGYVLRARHIDAEVLSGAIASYVLLGVAWASLYGLFASMQPSSKGVFYVAVLIGRLIGLHVVQLLTAKNRAQ